MGTVSNTRVADLLSSALSLFGKTGQFWVRGEEVKKDIKGNTLGYCMIGAIRNVEGFTSAEKRAAEVKLATLLAKDGLGMSFSEFLENSYDPMYDGKLTEDIKRALEGDWRYEIIAHTNDDQVEEFSEVRGFLNRLISSLRKKK